ncbi:MULTISPECIES: SDR family oxidoreductase [Lactobacillaceae]|uniref:SDR family oxidoreductase n=1 Tax=Lactobacillaceae TaxID=33958 RepID=UPI0018A128F6|nr:MULTISPECIES: SDR family oxidoreductase [Lactobacillaceae]MBF7140667.1 SDR family oxidoreductase [Pediococcus pentosaceus]MCH8626014.1 SDR family oxidoreductase [Lactiplantibacillus plantarum]MCH8632373.1 SDR family oxidoreductase [Lactiplantibacillus plantarum]MCH8635423.1 SDR family oxidoreductase [Lactiplantibacillus plantarum]MCT4452115.1 SDR family oxidoreductase [Lactiplantibacillus plantarum]
MSDEHRPKSQEPKKGYLQKDEDAYLSEQPKLEADGYAPGQSLKNKIAVITGGDSGIGAATAILFAKEGAQVVLVHYESDADAERTAQRISEVGKEPVVFDTDIGDEGAVAELASKITEKFPKIDILVNNAGEQHVHEHLQDITAAEFTRTFQTNVLGMFMLTKALFMSLSQNAAIINTASITAYAGAPTLIDYSASKGAIVSFTRSLSQNKDVLEKGIRVNAVAPGPIWTPLIPSTFNEDQLKTWGKTTPMGRAGQPYEVAPAYLYLASGASQYVTGQTVHVNGGRIING